MKKAVLLLALLATGASPAAAQSGGYAAPVNQPPEPVLPRRADLACSRLVAELRALRAEALAQQQRDGGTLTPEHRALIQARLDAAWQRYHRTPKGRRARRCG